MAHHAIKRLGPTGLIAIFVALTMSLIGAGTAIAAAGGSNEAKGPVVAHTKAGKMKAPVTGTTEDGRKVKGSFTPSEFQAMNDAARGDRHARGQDHGEGSPEGLHSTMITMHRSRTRSAGAPSAGKAVGTCDILNLVLGPLDLNVLGLEMRPGHGRARHRRQSRRWPAGSACCVPWPACWTVPAASGRASATCSTS